MSATAIDHLGAPDETRFLLDTHEAVDALHRFAAGQDQRDEALFVSAFAPDATLDFTQPAARFGGDVPVMVGIDVITDVLTTLEPLATTHTVTNPRVTFAGDEARLTCLVEAQHVERRDPSRHLLLKNRYDVDLRRDGDRFVITAMTIVNVWSEGDPAVLFGPGAVATAGASPAPVPAPVPAAAPVHVPADRLVWLDQGDGVELAPLRVDEQTMGGVAYLRFAADGRSGAHRHPAGEDLYLVSGRLRVGEIVLEPGDFLHTPPGGVHDAEALEPSLALVSVPEAIVFLDGDEMSRQDG